MPNLLTKFLQKRQRSNSPGPPPSPSNQPPINAVYYPNWAVYRPLPPSSLDLTRITHMLYAFVWPRADGSLASSDAYADDEIAVDGVRGGLAAVTALKRRPDGAHLKVLLSVGGGGQGSAHFAAVARSTTARETFANAVADLVRAHGFDGVDLDWEHPANADERAAYLILLRALRSVLPAPAFLLTAAVPAPPSLLQNYPLNRAATAASGEGGEGGGGGGGGGGSGSQSLLDLVFLMAYDFSGPWTATSDHHARLFGGGVGTVCGADAVAHLRDKVGVPAQRIVLGIPAYGRVFPGAGSVDRPYDKPADEEAATVEFNRLPQGNAMEWVDEAAGAAYSVSGDGFTSYDNAATVAAKARWARRQGLAGLFYWSALGDKQGDASLVKAGHDAWHSSP